MARRPGGRDPYTVIDLVPEPLRPSLREQGKFGLELAREWLEASDAVRADIETFFASDHEGEEWKR
jgi:hypothetical protein